MIRVLTILLTLSIASCAKPTRSSTASLVLVGGFVVDLDAGLVRRADVLVENQSIVAVGDVRTSRSARRVDVTGHYLLPGLCDAHVHLRHADDAEALLLNGITTAREMRGTAESLPLREKLNRRLLAGPVLVVASECLGGSTIDSLFAGFRELDPSSDAREIVEAIAREGYDGIKVYDYVPAAFYRQLLREARRKKLPVWGHVPFEVGLHKALEMGQASIEHLRGWIVGLGHAAAVPYGSEPWWRLHADVKLAASQPLVELAAKTGSVQVPTLVALERTIRIDARKEAITSSFLSRFDRAALTPLIEDVPDGQSAEAMFRKLQALVARLHGAGIPIVAGSDFGFAFVGPGDLHRELQLLVESGLSNREALQACTTEASKLLPMAGKFGVIRPGFRADVLVLKENPLTDVRATRSIAGILHRGSWISSRDRDTRLVRLRRRYRARSLLRPYKEDPGVERVLRFDIFSAGVLRGEERVVVPSGQSRVSSTQVLASPIRESRSIRAKWNNGKVASFSSVITRGKTEHRVSVRYKDGRLTVDGGEEIDADFVWTGTALDWVSLTTLGAAGIVPAKCYAITPSAGKPIVEKIALQLRRNRPSSVPSTSRALPSLSIQILCKDSFRIDCVIWHDGVTPVYIKQILDGQFETVHQLRVQ